MRIALVMLIACLCLVSTAETGSTQTGSSAPCSDVMARQGEAGPILEKHVLVLRDQASSYLKARKDNPTAVMGAFLAQTLSQAVEEHAERKKTLTRQEDAVLHDIRIVLMIRGYGGNNMYRVEVEFIIPCKSKNPGGDPK